MYESKGGWKKKRKKKKKNGRQITTIQSKERKRFVGDTTGRIKKIDAPAFGFTGTLLVAI